MEINQITELILRCAYTVHSALGPGLLESAFEECLYVKLGYCSTSMSHL